MDPTASAAAGRAGAASTLGRGCLNHEGESESNGDETEDAAVGLDDDAAAGLDCVNDDNDDDTGGAASQRVFAVACKR